MDASKPLDRSRKESDSADDAVDGRARASAATSSRSGLGTCFSRIAEAERVLAEPGESSTFLVKPSLLDPLEDVAGSLTAWTRELAFDNDSIAQLGLKIELPDLGTLRARKLVIRSRRLMTGKYPSWKMGRQVHWESRLESKVFRLLDVCPGVTKFGEQPFTIHYFINGIWRAHVPDVAFLTYDGKLWILEIKSNLDRNIQQAIIRAALISPRLKCLGINYMVARQTLIEAGASVENASSLVRFGRAPGSGIAEKKILDLVSERSNLSRANLIGHALDGRHAFHTAANLAMRGDVSLNWADANREPLQLQTLRDTNAEESLSWLQRALGATR
ncbi:hypothetical protein [Arenimonas sp. MALMAid1274]|uniref:hypothetical protein n=1 Tax=Arenimonas sp. MALMAid1274 TaxID=3411630 RepID=UPI003B9FF7F7